MIQFKVNGNPVQVKDELKEQFLLRYLRDCLGLKGTKEGCSTGHCGACTVLVDGEPKRACITKLKLLEGKSVETIESVGGDGTDIGKLHPIQKAFLDTGAIQCGFCTPGFIMAAKGLLDSNPDPTREDIEKALKANYCRCTGFLKIIEAIELAAARMKGLDSIDRSKYEETRIFLQQENADPIEITDESNKIVQRVLGKPLWDADGPKKACGSLVYADDLELPGTVYGAPVWAMVPHGVLKSLDYSKALTLPGAIDVITAEDVPGLNGYGLLKQDQPIFVEIGKETTYYRDVICLCVAKTNEEAREMAKAVEFEIEELPAVFDMQTALKKDMVHKWLGHDKGDLKEAKADPDVLKFSGHFTTMAQEHAYLEPVSTTAVYTDEKGLLIYAPTQSPFEMRRVFALIMGEDQERVRVIVTPVGGGFGSKADFYMEPAASVAVRKLKVPVKITLTREEDFSVTTKRHPYDMQYEMGITKDGILSYYDGQFLSDGGPYMNLSARVIDQACLFSVGPYRMPNGHIDGYALKTNNIPGSAFRGFGINQANFCMETLLDEAAVALNMDPFELRLKNCFKLGDQTVSGEYLTRSVGIKECLIVVRDATKEALKKYEGKYPNGDKVLGWGMAAGFKNVGAGKGKVDDAGAIYTELENGKIEVRISGVDMGQGFRTAMQMLAAETIDVPVENIVLVNGDTALTLHHGNAVGERQTLISGSACVKAGKKFKELREKRANGENIPSPISVSEVYIAPKTFALDDLEGRASVGPYDYHNYPGYAYTCQSAIIELDKKTGKVKVLEVVCGHDCGKVLNPHIVEGQLQGSCYMGIGYALSEEFPYKDGKPTIKYFGQLGLPTVADTPKYNMLLVEDPDPDGPYGAKGVSEIATVPMTPAIINAIYNAVGVRIRHLPAKPEDILKAMKEKEQQ